MSSYRFTDNSKTPLLNVAISDTTTRLATAKAIDFETYTFQAEWTGTLVGVISVLGSVDGINFRDFGVGVPLQPSGSPAGVLIPLFGHGMHFLRLQFVPASGSGQFTVTALGKSR